MKNGSENTCSNQYRKIHPKRRYQKRLLGTGMKKSCPEPAHEIVTMNFPSPYGGILISRQRQPLASKDEIV
jgi:hypothetical protein